MNKIKVGGSSKKGRSGVRSQTWRSIAPHHTKKHKTLRRQKKMFYHNSRGTTSTDSKIIPKIPIEEKEEEKLVEELNTYNLNLFDEDIPVPEETNGEIPELEYLGYESESYLPNSIKRDMYLIKFKNGFKFPTLQKKADKTSFPAYVSTGTNFSKKQQGKLTIFSGIALGLSRQIPEILKYYQNHTEYIIKNLNSVIVDKDKNFTENYMFRFIDFFSDLFKKNKESELPADYMENIPILTTWICKLQSSADLVPPNKKHYRFQNYSGLYPNLFNYQEGDKNLDVFQFLGGYDFVENCGEDLNLIEYKDGNKITTDSYINFYSNIPPKPHSIYIRDDYTCTNKNQEMTRTAISRTHSGEEADEEKLSKLENLLSVRYGGNKILYSIRNLHKNKKYSIPVKEKKELTSYEINKKIGANNIFGFDLTKVHTFGLDLSKEATPDKLWELTAMYKSSLFTYKHTKIFSYLVDMLFLNNSHELTIEFMVEEFDEIITLVKKYKASIGELIYEGEPFPIDIFDKEEKVFHTSKKDGKKSWFPTEVPELNLSGKSPNDIEELKFMNIVNSFLRTGLDRSLGAFIILLDILYDKIIKKNGQISTVIAHIFRKTNFINFVTLHLNTFLLAFGHNPKSDLSLAREAAQKAEYALQMTQTETTAGKKKSLKKRKSKQKLKSKKKK